MDASSNHSLNAFYRDYSQRIILVLILAMFGLIAMVGLVLYQVTHRPLPEFMAQSIDGRKLALTPYTEPNMVPGNLLRWASKAVVAAYTFDFVNYDKQIGLARSYFTTSGWKAYQSAIAAVIQRVKKSQIFVNGVVSGPPVISHQGDLIGHGYTWRVEIPFLVTYQSAEESRAQNYYVVLLVVKVPTTQTPDGVGIDQFQMIAG